MKSGVTKLLGANAQELDVLDGLQFRTVPRVPGGRRALVLLFMRADLTKGSPAAPLTEANQVQVELKRNESTIIERSPIPQATIVTKGTAGQNLIISDPWPDAISDPFHVFIANPNDIILINAYAGAVAALLSVNIQFRPAP